MERAARARVPLAPGVYAELLEACHANGEWQTLLGVYHTVASLRAGQVWSTPRARERALDLAGDALEALGASARGHDHASRQLNALRRQQEVARRSRVAVQRREATMARSERAVIKGTSSDRVDKGAPDKTSARGVAAGSWRRRLLREAGGLAALRGENLEAVSRLMELADTLATSGLGWPSDSDCDEDYIGDDQVELATFAELQLADVVVHDPCH